MAAAAATPLTATAGPAADPVSCNVTCAAAAASAVAETLSSTATLVVVVVVFVVSGGGGRRLAARLPSLRGVLVLGLLSVRRRREH